jgi:hypothetical protein
LRVSQIHIQVVLLDKYDAPQTADTVTFIGDAESTAVQKAGEFLISLTERVEKMEVVSE